MKKAISIVLTMILILSLSVTLVACKTTPEESSEFVLEDDSYNMLGSSETFGKLIDIALESIGSGIRTGTTKVASNVADWVAKGVLNALGFSYGQDQNFQKQVLENLNNINSAIVNLEDKIDWLTESFNNQNYLNVYRNFVKDYKELAPSIQVPNEILIDINENIKDPVKLEKAIDDLCFNIHDGSVAESELDRRLRTLSTYFVGENTQNEQLGQYSIFNIVERFVTTQTPYLQNQYAQIEEVLSYPYSIYCVGYSLVVLDYVNSISDRGIENFYLANDGTLVAYELKDESGNLSTYLNTSSSKLAEFKKTYGEELTKHGIADKPAQSIVNVPDGTNVSFLFGYLKTCVAQYNTISNIYKEFISKYESADKEKLTMTSLNQNANKKISTVWARDFLNPTEIGENGQIQVNYSKFGNITKSDFIKFAQTIAPYCVSTNADGSRKDLTFKEFFIREGFEFPTNNSSSYLLLGAEKGPKDYEEWYNNGFKFKNAIATVSVDLNTKVVDFLKNQNFVRKYYALYASKTAINSTCTPKYRADWYFVESKETRIRSGMTFLCNDLSTWKNRLFETPVTYYTIFGLSANAKNNTTSSVSF